ncbi:ribulose-phosphate 3-epimerase [Patescibacteria group bacterium AH-259-L05]|nr:ribulose-phosphate 3-epimerase [Patescibacteria group bacterium AH-259-L05]
MKKIIPAILTDDVTELKGKLDKLKGLVVSEFQNFDTTGRGSGKRSFPVGVTGANEVSDARGRKPYGEHSSRASASKYVLDWVQIDIMDGRFVNNTSLDLKDLTKISAGFNLEAHLMVLEPEKYLQSAQDAHMKRVIFHVEAVDDVDGIIEKIRTYGFEIGIALNPETDLEKVLPYKDMADVILFLGVKPGFGGQVFKPSVIDKIKRLREIDSNILIEVDGGVKLDNISVLNSVGADYFVIGTGLFSAPDIKERFKQLQQKLT